MLTNMFYGAAKKSEESVSEHTIFLIQQVDLLGGIDFIFKRRVINLVTIYQIYLLCILHISMRILRQA